MTKTQATELARAAKSATHLAGTEDMRLADACADAGYQLPGEYSYLWHASGSLQSLAATVQRFAVKAAE